MDIEMLKYQQNGTIINSFESKSSQEPYKEEQRFFEENKKIFSYEEMSKVFQNLGKNTIFTLRDGNKVQVVKGRQTLAVSFGKPGNAKFSAQWTTLNDPEELGKVFCELNDIINQQ